MQLGAGAAHQGGQAAFDRQMNVLVRKLEFKPAAADLAFDSAQAALDPRGFGAAEQPHPLQHPGVRNRTADVVAVQTAVKGQRGGEALDLGQAGYCKPAADQAILGGYFGGAGFHG